MAKEFSHLDETGTARMVDVGAKQITSRHARAAARISTSSDTIDALRAHTIGKGDVFAVARVAGVMAAKKTADLIPLTHPLGLDQVEVDLTITGDTSLEIFATARCSGRTGVEMEAMTACAVAALTVYDMCKSSDRSMSIDYIRLEEKSGGKSGDWRRSQGVD